MRVVIELTEKEIEALSENAGFEVEDSVDAEFAIHFLLDSI